jgi:hypothetical protein
MLFVTMLPYRENHMTYYTSKNAKKANLLSYIVQHIQGHSGIKGSGYTSNFRRQNRNILHKLKCKHKQFGELYSTTHTRPFWDQRQWTHKSFRRQNSSRQPRSIVRHATLLSKHLNRNIEPLLSNAYPRPHIYKYVQKKFGIEQ